MLLRLALVGTLTKKHAKLLHFFELRKKSADFFLLTYEVFLKNV